MKNTLSLLLLILILIAISVVEAKDLEVPELIDFGICYTGTTSLNTTYMKEVKIVNNSSKIIYLRGLAIEKEYPNFISSRGNYLSFFDHVFKDVTPERGINPGDTAGFSLWYRSSFQDTISIHDYLQAKLLYVYHYENDTTEHYDTSKIRMRSIDKDTIFSTGDYYVTWDYCEEKAYQFDWDLTIRIFNKSNEVYIIDSVNYTDNGNFTFHGYSTDPLTYARYSLNFPVEILSNGIIFLKTSLPFPTFSFNQINFSIFCRNKETNEQIILLDSARLKVSQPLPVIVHSNLIQVVAFLGDTIKNKYFRVSFCGADSLVADSIKLLGDFGNNKFIINSATGEFPIFIDDYILRYATIEFIANEFYGYMNGNFVSYFHDKYKKQYIRYTPFTAYVYPYANDVDDNIDENNYTLIYPNPASEFVYLKNMEMNGYPFITGKIFNVLGEEMTEFISTDNPCKINLEKFNDGIYFIVIKSGNTFLRKKFIIQK